MNRVSFWSNVDRLNGPDSCWLWCGAVNGSGYGYAYIDGKVDGVHRHVLRMMNVEIGGRHVLHRCDTPLCCNPTHLFLGTPRDNALDCKAKGRQNGIAKRHIGSAHGRAKLTEADVAYIRFAASGRVKGRDATTGRYLPSVVKGLAVKYSVSLTTISLVIARKIWTHVP